MLENEFVSLGEPGIVIKRVSELLEPLERVCALEVEAASCRDAQKLLRGDEDGGAGAEAEAAGLERLKLLGSQSSDFLAFRCCDDNGLLPLPAVPCGCWDWPGKTEGEPAIFSRELGRIRAGQRESVFLVLQLPLSRTNVSNLYCMHIRAVCSPVS